MKLAEELYKYFDKHFKLKDECSSDTIYDLRLILNKHYNKPIDECLDVIEKIPPMLFHRFIVQLKSKLEGMKDPK